MGRAQERDAARSKKFYFRREVFSTVRSGASTTSSSGDSTPSDRFPIKKEKKMGNCFPPPQLPEDGVLNRLPVDKEYDEFTMNEIMNGKVRRSR